MANPVEVNSVGVTAGVSFTPAAAAYTALDIMSVAKEMTWTFCGSGLAVPRGSLIRITTTILRIDQTGLQASEAGYNLKLYSVTPPSAQADNDAWTLASADLTAYRGSISLGTPVDEGAASFIKQTGLIEDTRLDAARDTQWAELQTVAGFTATAVARQVQLLGFLL